MTKDVLIAIRGLQFETDMDADKIEIITVGNYYKRNNSHFVVFEEATEGTDGLTKSIIRFNETEFDLTKKGLVNAHMIFQQDKKNITNYATPYGNLAIGIEAEKIRLEESEHEISVNLRYALEVNYEYLADCNITMDIRQRDAHGLSLLNEETGQPV